MIDVVMLTSNRARITELSLTEIIARTTSPYRLIVMDNGSGPSTTTMLMQYYAMGNIQVLLLNKENTGVHFGHNRLLDLVESPLFVMTDNDIIPESPDQDGDWLSKLERLMNANPGYAAIACRPHVMIGANVQKMFEGEELVVERSHVGAVLRMMPAGIVREVGGWKNEKAPSRNNEEWFISDRLRAVGWKVGYSAKLHAIHLFGEPEFQEDPWGYPLGMEHGHRPISPPVNTFAWDKMGIDWRTCRGPE